MINNTPQSIYIHIPFCLDKCHYCAFVSFKDKLSLCKSCFDALIKEINEIKNSTISKIKTIYIGGGTPSIIDIKHYERLFDTIYSKFDIDSNAEITFEINPATVNVDYLRALKSLGINRLSVGAQSFDERILKLINRKHSSEEIVEAIENSKKAGFENISLDLIYGLPEQTLPIVLQDLNKAVSLDIKHISVYGLKIEENTRFFKQVPENLPDEDLCADMYLKIIEKLEDFGFKHYEISNFAQKGFESKHNVNYWKNNQYYGFGVAAHGYVDEVRYSNSESIEEYIENPCSRAFSQELKSKEKIEEAIFLGLRMTSGIDLKSFKDRYDFDIVKNYSAVIKKYTELELLEIKEARLKLTIKGLLLSNVVMAEFLS